MQKIKIPAFNNKNIAANLYTPKDQTKKLAILCPGYLHSKDHIHLKTLAEEFEAKGYTVITFDPTGTWESDGSIFDYTITEYLRDIKTVLDYMWENEKYESVLLGGHSRGGAVSLIFAAKDKRISQVLGIMASPLGPFSDDRQKLWKERGAEVSFQSLPGNSVPKEFRVPFSYVEDRAKYTVAEAVKSLKIPILLIYGEKDEVVTPDNVRELFEIANEPKKILNIPQAKHNYWEEPGFTEIINKRIIEVI